MSITKLRMSIGYDYKALSGKVLRHERSQEFKVCVDRCIHRVVPEKTLAAWANLDSRANGTPKLDTDENGVVTFSELRKFIRGHLAAEVSSTSLSVENDPGTMVCVSTPFGWWSGKTFNLTSNGEPWLLTEAVDDYENTLPESKRARFAW